MSSFDLPPEVAFLESSDEAVVVIDVEGARVAMSKPAQELADVAAEDMVGDFVEMPAPSNRRGYQAYRRGSSRSPTSAIWIPGLMDPGLEPELERPDGTLVPMRVDGNLSVAAYLTRKD